MAYVYSSEPRSQVWNSVPVSLLQLTPDRSKLSYWFNLLDTPVFWFTLFGSRPINHSLLLTSCGLLFDINTVSFWKGRGMRVCKICLVCCMCCERFLPYQLWSCSDMVLHHTPCCGATGLVRFLPDLERSQVWSSVHLSRSFWDHCVPLSSFLKARTFRSSGKQKVDVCLWIYNRGQKGLRIVETLCDFGPVMKTRATMMAPPPPPPLSHRPMLFVLGWCWTQAYSNIVLGGKGEDFWCFR